MKIINLRITGLSGGTVDGGWPGGMKPEEDINTVVEVLTDEGLTGIGSAMTSKALIEAAIQLLRPLLIGERADEPARVSEKLRQSMFWQGRGGAVEHAISGIDIALWDLMGKICNQPVSRLLGGRYRARIKPYGSILFDEPAKLRESLHETVARGFKAIKLGWRPFGRGDRASDELLIRTARDAVGPNVELMVDAGGSEGPASGRHRRLCRTSTPCAAAHRGRGSLDSPSNFSAVFGTERGRYYTTRLHEMRRFDRGLAHRLDGL